MYKVLVIDNDDSGTGLLKTNLESVGIEVIHAGAPSVGLELASTQKPNVIILDSILPVAISIELCQAIRNISKVPILVLSIIDQPKVAAKVLDSGADDYLIKPVPESILLAHLKRLNNRKSDIQPPPTNNYRYTRN